MSRWSGRASHRPDGAQPEPTTRAQVEPLAALVAVFAVGVALTTYAGLLDATLPTPDGNLAEPTVERAERAVADHGVVAPTALREGLRVGPDGYRVNLTLTAAGETWHVGPVPPTSPAANGVDHSETRVSVRVESGRIRPGRLRAEVWR